MNMNKICLPNLVNIHAFRRLVDQHPQMWVVCDSLVLEEIHLREVVFPNHQEGELYHG
jgi:hypothetical protein